MSDLRNEYAVYLEGQLAKLREDLTHERQMRKLAQDMIEDKRNEVEKIKRMYNTLVEPKWGFKHEELIYEGTMSSGARVTATVADDKYVVLRKYNGKVITQCFCMPLEMWLKTTGRVLIK